MKRDRDKLCVLRIKLVCEESEEDEAGEELQDSEEECNKCKAMTEMDAGNGKRNDIVLEQEDPDEEDACRIRDQ